MSRLLAWKPSVYGLAFLARGLVVSLLIPMSVIALTWRADMPIEIPNFTAIWLSAWLFSLVLTMRVSMRRWASVGTHAIVYLAACSALLFEWGAVCWIQAGASLLWWTLFDAGERMYRSYKLLSEAGERAKVLESRIRPHFVFNVLNNLRALAQPESLIARGLDDSAELLRAALMRTASFVSYCDERELVEQYLRLESLRLEDRLQVEWTVEDDVEDENPWMPGFIMQPIVENAIRHGVEQHGGSIRISLRHEKSYFVLEVANACPVDMNACEDASVAKNLGGHTGLGLAEQDVRGRLNLLYDEHASYQRVYREQECIVTIKFPWKLQ